MEGTDDDVTPHAAIPRIGSLAVVLGCKLEFQLCKVGFEGVK
jgi:hypothetical protein